MLELDILSEMIVRVGLGAHINNWDKVQAV